MPPAKKAPAKKSVVKQFWQKAYKQKNSYIRRGLVAGGGAIGRALLPTGGDYLGRMAGTGIADLIGAGRYSLADIKYNSALSLLPENATLHSQVPSMHKTGNGEILVSHREYMGEVISSSTADTFKVDKYPVNPAMRETFPWLSAIAQQFESYRIRGMVFEFRSNSGNALNSTNTALGSVQMGVSYRPSSLSPTNKQQVLNLDFGSESVPSKDFITALECEPSTLINGGRYYTRGSDELPADDSINTYDMANFYISSSGVQGTNVVLGSVFCSYQILLQKPIDSADQGAWLHQAHYVGPARTITTTNGGNNVFNGLVEVHDGIGITFPASDTIQFPRGTVGKYLLYIGIIGSAQTLGTWTPTLTNCVHVSGQYNTGGSDTNLLFCYAVNIIDPAKVATVKLVGTGTPSDWTQHFLKVIQLSNTIF
ncbi:capsid protein [Crucivirus-190]|nr:capsid protein [Crucivirus-190]